MSTLHQVDVFNLDGSAVAEINQNDGEADGSLGGGDRQHQHRHHLTGQVVQHGGERDEIEVDGEQDQFDRHQHDDDVLAVEEDSEHADHQQDAADDQIMIQAD